MKLVNPSDDELDAAFGNAVASWHPNQQQIEAHRLWADISEGTITPSEAEQRAYILDRPKYTRSFDAVLPWLEKSPFDISIFYSQTCCHWTVRLQGRFTSNGEHVGECDIEDGGGMARAAVIALLRASGVEVEFTQ